MNYKMEWLSDDQFKLEIQNSESVMSFDETIEFYQALFNKILSKVKELEVE